MINTDEDALICDLAETYGIYNYRSFPCKMVATFSCGLRDDSRIKMKIAGVQATPEQMLAAMIADNTAMTAWLNSEDGRKGTNRPMPILRQLTGAHDRQKVISFDTGEDFEKEWKRLTGKVDE